jgi:hypothetical protein
MEIKKPTDKMEQMKGQKILQNLYYEEEKVENT